MIRVLHSVQGMGRGGIETFIMNVYRNIDRTKVQFDFLVNTKEKCDYDDEIVSLGGRIYYVPGRKEGIAKSKKNYNDFFRKHKEYKILHVHRSSLSDVTVLKIAKKNKVPYRIIHGHSTNQWGGVVHKNLHHFHKLFVNLLATHYFACSHTVARWMFPEKILINNGFKIVKNGIEIENFVFDKKIREQKRRELGVSDKFVLGHVGRFHPVKNHQFLLEVFKKIQKNKPDSVLLLVGDGVLRQEIENRVEAEGLKEKVVFTGLRPDVSDLYQAMDVFVMPSFYEGFPVTLVEAQAAGLKCIVSSNIGIETRITDLVTFKKLTDGPDAWADEILKESNYKRENKYSSLSDQGFNIKSIAYELQEFYINLLMNLKG